jgi:DNA mismatch endonuclease, patch repair protein
VVDSLTPAERSERMGRIRGRDSTPELRVRRLVFSLGYRYRLHVSRLPGRPDLVFPGRRKVIFVHGCFWHRHRHSQCPLSRLPKSRLDFWLPKLEGNSRRDRRNIAALRHAGWGVLVVWECELRAADSVSRRIQRFLERDEDLP